MTGEAAPDPPSTPPPPASPPPEAGRGPAKPGPAPAKAPPSAGTAAPGDRERQQRDVRATPDESEPEEYEAYRRGRYSLQEYHRSVDVQHSLVQTLNVGDTYHKHKHVFGRARTKKKDANKIAPVLVRARALAGIRGTFVPPGGYPGMLAGLRDHRVAVLWGKPGTGRTTTALHLLDEVARDSVYELDLAGEIDVLRKRDLKAGRGYLVRTSAGQDGRSPHAAHLDQLRDRLAGRECYCVLVVSAEWVTPDEDEGYHHDCAPPAVESLLRVHIRQALGRGAESGAVSAEEQALLRLWADERVLAAFGPSRRPSDIVRLARLLAKAPRDGSDVETLVVECHQLVEQQIAHWFGEPPSDKGAVGTWAARAAFRIALAVLNESPYSVVREQSQRLATLLAGGKVSSGDRTSSGHRKPELLAAAHAHIVHGTATLGTGTGPTELVSFEDHRYPSLVLRSAWEQQSLRPALVEWLREFSQSRRPMLSVRAAQAAGRLTALDFYYGYDKLIRPQARDKSRRCRRFAALALDEAARHPHGRSLALSFLRHWIRQGNAAERWTAAAALGYQLALDLIDGAVEGPNVFNELLILGTPAERGAPLADDGLDRDMLDVVSRSLSQLVAFGSVEPVLSRLDEWLHHPRSSVRLLAIWAVVRLANMQGSQLGQSAMSGGRVRPSGGRGYERWPLLLAIQHRDPRFAPLIAKLLREGLRGRFGDAVLTCLRSWITSAARDEHQLAALTGFLPDVVRNADDAARLDHLLARMRRDWAQPLAPEVADVVEGAIQNTGHREEQYSWRMQNAR